MSICINNQESNGIGY